MNNLFDEHTANRIVESGVAALAAEKHEQGEAQQPDFERNMVTIVRYNLQKM